MPREAEMWTGRYCDMIPRSQNIEISGVSHRRPLVHDGLLNTHTTVEKLSEVVFSSLSILKMYRESLQDLDQSCQTWQY